jgi:2-oxoglutarate ferredoxin oxidoreductase subunit alpha
MQQAQPQPGSSAARVERREAVVVRFAGDSGDGMQLAGSQMTLASVLAGNDVATFPDFPAEIRAPTGTLAGVSGFQLQFAAAEVFTPGDAIDVLVAMNPAALAKNVAALRPGGLLIANGDAFTTKNLKMAGYDGGNPLQDGTLADFQVVVVELARLTRDALAHTDLTAKEVERSKNYFALGLMCWLYERRLDVVEEELRARFSGKPRYLDANLAVLRGGWAFGENTELFRVRYQVPAAPAGRPGVYRNISGNEATALGLIAASQRSGRPLFLGSYPITPASDILHTLAAQKHFGVRTFQAEDEIAAVCAAIGAAWGNQLAVTTTSGPGLALKSEAIGLAVMTELPLVVIDVQRGGPSTGLPTKTEQADLLQALWGRNGECPVAVLAARSPSDAFDAAYEACRIATKYMLPVLLLTDGAIANGAEPWRVPEPEALPAFAATLLADAGGVGEAGFQPYTRDPETLARPWPLLGTAGLEHRIGGLEKWDGSGHIAYDPENHDHMVRLRQRRVDGIAAELPPCELTGPDAGDLLVVSWGSTYGACLTAVRRLQREGRAVAHLHLRWLNPLPADLGEVLQRFGQVLVPEMNLGQLYKVLRARFDFRGAPFNRVAGQPLRVDALVAVIEQALAG